MEMSSVATSVSEQKQSLRRNGYMILPAAARVHYTVGLSLSKCHPDFVLDGADAPTADVLFRTMAERISTGVAYHPGIYEILGMEVEVSAMSRSLMQKWLPVAWKLISTDLKALRLRIKSRSPYAALA